MVFHDLSFPRRRESRFVFSPICLDTRFRGYDDPTAFVLYIISAQVFSKEVTKDPEPNIYNLPALRVLRGKCISFMFGCGAPNFCRSEAKAHGLGSTAARSPRRTYS